MKEQKKPIWMKYYIDLILLAISVILFNELLTRTHTLESQLISEGNYVEIVKSYNSLVMIGFPLPFLVFIGLIMLIVRIFPLITEFLSKWLWTKRGGLFSFALRNTIRKKHISTKATLLIAFNVAIIVAFLSAPLSNTLYQQKVIYNQIGSDMTINVLEESYLYNSTFQSEIKDSSSDVITSLSPAMILIPNLAMGLNLHMKILVLDSTNFFQNAWFPENMRSNDLEQELFLLDAADNNNSSFIL